MANEESTSREEVRSRRISTEEMVRQQVDRINAIRSDVTDPERVPKWSEANEALADTLLPWHDEAYAKAWEERRVAVVTLSDGRVVPVPNARDCREATLILFALMDRNGLSVKRRNVSGPAPKARPETMDSVDVPM